MNVVEFFKNYEVGPLDKTYEIKKFHHIIESSEEEEPRSSTPYTDKELFVWIKDSKLTEENETIVSTPEEFHYCSEDQSGQTTSSVDNQRVVEREDTKLTQILEDSIADITHNNSNVDLHIVAEETHFCMDVDCNMCKTLPIDNNTSNIASILKVQFNIENNSKAAFGLKCASYAPGEECIYCGPLETQNIDRKVSEMNFDNFKENGREVYDPFLDVAPDFTCGYCIDFTKDWRYAYSHYPENCPFLSKFGCTACKTMKHTPENCNKIIRKPVVVQQKRPPVYHSNPSQYITPILAIQPICHGRIPNVSVPQYSYQNGEAQNYNHYQQVIPFPHFSYPQNRF